MKQKQMFLDLRKNRTEKKKAERERAKEMAEIERAAQAAYSRDVEDGLGGASASTRREYRPGERELMAQARDEEARRAAAAAAAAPSTSAPRTTQDFINFYNQKFARGQAGEGGDAGVSVGTEGWARYSVDKKYYRAIVIKVLEPADGADRRLSVRYTDYGNQEDVDQDAFTTSEPALWMKPPGADAQTTESGEAEGAADASNAVPGAKSGVPGKWTVATESVWGSNERTHRERVAERKRSALSRGDKYTGGDESVGFGRFATEIDADDYGLGSAATPEGLPASATAVTGAKRKAGAPTVSFKFKKRGKKRPRNIRSKSGL